ncbi:hypothetical protein [Nocardia wallacei]|uniref:hypothetical protein n=1 Tax=Nocardia wallacei TaxID=480035 RepID=UPI002457BDFE|nr:hypothetical protein [Nocardia wallacei]
MLDVLMWVLIAATFGVFAVLVVLLWKRDYERANRTTGRQAAHSKCDSSANRTHGDECGWTRKR